MIKTYPSISKQFKPIKSPNVKSELAPKCTFCLISMKQRIIFLRSMGGPRGSNIDWRGQNWKKFGWNVLWLKWFQRNIEETDRDGSFRADSTEKLESGRKLKNPKEKTDDDWNQEEERNILTRFHSLWEFFHESCSFNFQSHLQLDRRLTQAVILQSAKHSLDSVRGQNVIKAGFIFLQIRWFRCW